MGYQRREFLKAASALATGIAITGVSSQLSGCHAAAGLHDNKKAFGIQLYTVRDELPKDVKGTLKKIASFGYKQVEGYERDMGLFWGMSNTDFKKYMDDLGMNFISSHCDIDKDFDRKANEAAAINMKYLLAPYLGPQKSLDDYKRYADKLNDRAAICKKAGIKFGYHNHDYSFKKLDGQFPQDVIMSNTDKDNIDFEMDMYWVVSAGQDPLAWFKKYPGRFTLGHVKDMRDNKSTVLGTGTIDYQPIIKEAKKAGMKYFIVEQEDYVKTTQLEAAEKCAAYMKTLNL